jgi:hypothetical protein
MRLCNWNNCDLFRMEGRREEPLKSRGRARGRRTVPVCGPGTIPVRGPHEPGLESSVSSIKIKVKLFLSTPLRLLTVAVDKG